MTSSDSRPADPLPPTATITSTTRAPSGRETTLGSSRSPCAGACAAEVGGSSESDSSASAKSSLPSAPRKRT